MHSCLSIWKVARNSYQCWLRSSKLIVLGVLLIFVRTQVVEPLQGCSLLMEEKLSFLEPFVALGNSGMVLLILPLVYLVLMSGYPQKDGNELFYFVRTGKRSWILGQIIFAVLSAISFIVFLLISSAALSIGNSEIRLEYSHAVTHFVSRYPERWGDYAAQMIPQNLYNHISLKTACFHSILLLFFYFLLLALILLMFTIWKKRYLGLFVNGFLIIAGAVGCSGNTAWMWIFPMPHTISWFHYTEYLQEPIMSMKVSYLYFLVLDLLLIVLCFLSAKRLQVEEIG